MRCQISSQSMLLVKGFLLYALFISFVERQLNTEARPNSDQKDKLNAEQLDVEVEHLQNTSSCTYTVDPVKESYVGWHLKQLYHIRCVNASEHCSANNGPRHVCMQTHKWIKVNKKTEEKMKLYTGCVCALRHHHKGVSIINTND